MEQVTVGIDIGTTSVKAVAADAAGGVRARARVPHRLVAPDARRFEHDPAEAWSAGVLEAWRQVSAGYDVAAVTVAAMVPSLCGVDDAGRPVTVGLLYGDSRGDAAGGASGIEGEALGFARWLAEHSGAARYWPAQAVANHALCGVGVIDTTTAMTMMPMFDGTGWDAAVCAQLGFGPDRLPALSPGSAPVGAIPGTGTLVSGGTVDVLGEQLVADAHRPGDVLVLCGTTLIPSVLTEGWPEVDGLWTMPFTVPGITALGGASNAGGLFVDAVRRLVGPVTDDELAAVDPGAVPVWLPYIRGERTPLHDPHRRAELLGFEVGQGPAAVLRAAYEAAGFVVRHHVELAATASAKADRIVAAGGGTRSAAWMQALADATGLPVDVGAVPEGAALGAAFLSRQTAGLETDSARVRDWARVSHRVEPDPAWASACASRYERFLEGTNR